MISRRVATCGLFIVYVPGSGCGLAIENAFVSTAERSIATTLTSLNLRVSYAFPVFSRMCVVASRTLIPHSNTLRPGGLGYSFTHNNPRVCTNKQGAQTGIRLQMKHTSCLVHMNGQISVICSDGNVEHVALGVERDVFYKVRGRARYTINA